MFPRDQNQKNKTLSREAFLLTLIFENRWNEVLNKGVKTIPKSPKFENVIFPMVFQTNKTVYFPEI